VQTECDFAGLLTLDLYGSASRDGQCCGRQSWFGQQAKKRLDKDYYASVAA